MNKRYIILVLMTAIMSIATAQDFRQLDDDPLSSTTNNKNFGRSDSIQSQHKEIPKGLKVWTIDERFGDRTYTDPDTVSHMYMNSIFTTGLRGEYNTLGSLGSPRLNRIFIDREFGDTDFLFTHPYTYFLTPVQDFHFTNTLSPITNLSYNTCGNHTNGEDHFKAFFAVNAGKLFEAKRSAEEEINRLEENLQQFYSQHPAIQEERLIEFRGYANIEDLRQTCRERREALARAQGAVETCTEAYNRHHGSEHPPFEESDTVESLRQALDMGLKTLEDISKKITTLENQLKHDAAERERQKELLKKVAQLDATAQKWNTLNESFGGSDGMRFRLIAQSYLLENLLRSANLYLHDLDKRYKLECIPGTLTISLRDQYQPDMVSPVDTLSGGESFIVSLALALALASMNRQGLSIDTLFIDEGFGTLSENELNTVMTLLERLQAQKGKRVGVISHVRELRDRIPVHVEVRRLDPTRSGIRVIDRTAG